MPEHEAQGREKRRIADRASVPNKAANIVSATFLVAVGAFAVYSYMPSELPFRSSSAPAITGSLPPTLLSRETVRPLLHKALADAPIVLRVPLGDVVTVSSSGESIPVYAKLADAGLIRLRYCHFPGANGRGKEICVADLTEKGKGVTAEGSSSVITGKAPDFPASNRTYAQFTLAQLNLTDVADPSGEESNEATVAYRASIEPPPVATLIAGDQLPPEVSGKAKLRRQGPAWQIHELGLAL